MFTKRIPGSLITFVSMLLISVVSSACDSQNRPVRGFVLPPGNIERGKQVFIDQGCYQCHTLPAIELPERAANPAITLEIGGKVYRVKDYGELLDAIVSPNHIISANYRMALDKDERKNVQSPMPNFNEKLTVAELIDLVAFLHGQYIRMDPPDYQGYGYR